MSTEKKSSEIPLNTNEVILFQKRPKKLPKMYELKQNEYTLCDFEFITGNRTNTILIYDRDDKQMFTNSQNMCKYGERYRCQNRKCPAHRVLCNNNMLIKLNDSKPHNHDTNQEQRYKNLRALNSLKSMCRQVETIDGSSKRSFLRSIFKRVREE